MERLFDDLPFKKLLNPQQTQFIASFIARNDARTMLVAAPGMGKTTTARVAAAEMLSQGEIDRVLFVANNTALAEQWSNVWRGIDDSPSERAVELISAATTYSALIHDPEQFWGAITPGTRCLFVFDEIEWVADRLEAIASNALERFPGSRALFVSTKPPPLEVDSRFTFHQFFERGALSDPVTKSNLKKLAPSIGILQKVQRRLIHVEDLSWREFEQLIAGLLEADGYNVELMQGSKDGGVDVVATRDLGDAGLFKSVWQAKKHRIDRKIGLSIVRELADTRREHGASKALIVTTSYLTKDALDRVERDRYLLGKVDRGDLDRWVERTLRFRK